MTRNALAAPNNEAYGEGNGTVFLYNPSLSLKTLETGILLLAVFTLQLEIDHPSETSLCTVAPSPQAPLLRLFLGGRGGGAAVHRLSGADNPVFKSQPDCSFKIKTIHFQIKTYYLSDANHQTDNPSHTNNPSLV